MKFRLAMIVPLALILASCSTADMSRKDDFYSSWKNTDDSLNEFCTEPFTAEKAEAVRAAYSAYLGEYESFCATNIYTLSKMQYHELQPSYEMLDRVAESIKSFSSAEAVPSLQESAALRTQLQAAIIEYQHGKNMIAEKTGMLYSLMLIVFTVLTFCVFIIILVYRRIAATAREETVQLQQFSLAVMQGQEDERSRISLELHDTVAQNIKYAQMLSEQLVPLLSDDKKAQEVSQKIHDVDKKCIQDIRTLCYNLTPPDLALGNLKTALNHLVMTFTRDSGLSCSFAIAADTPLEELSPDRQLHVFRLVQESFTNIIKHAQAHDVSLVIRGTKENGILIIVTDDGCGFDPEQIRDGSEHFGVRGMRERVAAMNGKIEFISSAETGTEVRIEFPCA